MKSEILNTTRGVCGVCRQLVPAQVSLQEGKVYLERFCPEHGLSRGLISSDGEYYRGSLGIIKPGTLPFAFSTSVKKGCPDDCGLCPEHEQHTCMPIIEITDRCDLECPVCLVGNGRPFSSKRDMAVDDFTRILDTLIQAEGTLELINLSGGEPTLHPEFCRIVASARRAEILRVTVSTNGLRLAKDERLLDFLQENDILVSLQMDGFSSSPYQRLRGIDLLPAKEKLLRKLEEKRMACSWVVTLARGVNENEVGAILDYFFGNDHLISLMFQPLSHTGRCRQTRPNALDRLTIPDVIALLTSSSRGQLQASDFSPLPCSHPACFALTYLLKLDDGGQLPIPRIVPAADYLDIIQNRSLPGLEGKSFSRIQECVYQLWSSSGMAPDSQRILSTIKVMLQELCRNGCAPSPNRALAIGEQKIKSIFIHHFMDEDSFDLARAVKCCNHYPQVDGRLMPACTFNTLYRS